MMTERLALPSATRQRRTALTALRCALPFLLLAAGCGRQEQTISTPNELLIDARQLASEGQKDQAIEKLNASLEAGQTVWAYRLRAQLLAEQGQDEAALKDCEAALQIFPDDVDALWIKKELTRPLDQRFKGPSKNPPSGKR